MRGLNIRFASTIRNPTKVAAPEEAGQRAAHSNFPENSKAPLVRRGSAKLPVSTLSIKRDQYNIRSLAPSGRAEDDGLEP